MARILMIETATEVCSVALAESGKVVFFRENAEGNRHAELLTIFIEQVFRQSGWQPGELNAVCVSRGPGSYTGLRIGVSAGKGICYGLGIPLMAVSTLESLAWHVAFEEKFADYEGSGEILLCPMLDAKRNEVYTALFSQNAVQLTPVSAEIITRDSFKNELQTQRILFFGNGATKCKNLIQNPNAVFTEPVAASARFMSQPAELRYNKNSFENVAYFEPYYLKDFVATVPKNKIF
jgi:tRNA threonylcarbamoyladenosine biosynthesis protein TsaB